MYTQHERSRDIVTVIYKCSMVYKHQLNFFCIFDIRINKKKLFVFADTDYVNISQNTVKYVSYYSHIQSNPEKFNHSI